MNTSTPPPAPPRLRTSDFGLRTLRRQAWVKWVQLVTVVVWSLFPPFYSPMPAAWVPSSADPMVPVWEGEGEPSQNPAEMDSDGDGLSDWLEQYLGSSPGNPDSDYDGLSDSFELWTSNTSPINWDSDSDSDGFSDHDAYYGCWSVNHQTYGFGVTVYDWDGDGYYNPDDAWPFDPNNGSTPWVDSDGDGIPDHEDAWPYDYYNGSGGGGGSGSPDSDGDGIPDDQDAWPSDPYNGNPPPTDPDTDGDGAPDNVDTHPNDAGRWSDSNNNGFNDWEDTPYNTDTDGDGVFDAFDSDVADASLWNDFSPRNGINDESEPEGPPDPWTLADDDNDDYLNPGDSHPGNYSLWSDWDNDGLNAEAELLHGTDTQQPDTDNDGLTDGEEVQYQTNPLSPDTDGDGLTDFEELRNLFGSSALDRHSLSKLHGWGEAYTDWQLADRTDTDQDGIPDKIEDLYAPLMNKANPADGGWDLDADGVSNLQAYHNGWTLRSGITGLDRDGDGIEDVVEDSYPGILDKFDFSDAVEDPDGDDLMNWQEVAMPGFHPGQAQSRYPGVMDHLAAYWHELAQDVALYTAQGGAWWEFPALSRLPESYAVMVSAWGSTEDLNENALPDGLEAFLADVITTDLPPPRRVAAGDYDGDGMPDGWEWQYRPHLNVLNASDAGLGSGVLGPLPPPPDPNAFDLNTTEGQEAYQAAMAGYEAVTGARHLQDPDADELSNLMEYLLGTHPLIPDSDGDGVNDGAEVAHGTNPANGQNTPPTLLVIISGGQQTGVVGAVSGVPLSVRATRVGLPRGGIPVQFQSQGFGQVGLSANGPWSTQVTAWTSSAGEASVHWKAPATVGTGTIQAGSQEAETAPVSFSAGTVPSSVQPVTPVTPSTTATLNPWTTVRFVERSRKVFVSRSSGGIPSGSIVISPNGTPTGYFLPTHTQTFDDLQGMDDFLAPLERLPSGYYVDGDGEHLSVGDWLNIPPISAFAVTFGNLVETILPQTWYYGGGWSEGTDLSAPLSSSESVAATITAGGIDAPFGSVLNELNMLFLPFDSEDPNWRQLPVKTYAPYYCVEHESGVVLPPAGLVLSLQSASGNEVGEEGEQYQGRFLEGSKRLYWMARTRPLNANGDPDMDAELPELSQTWLRVVERVTDDFGNALPTIPQVSFGCGAHQS